MFIEFIPLFFLHNIFKNLKIGLNYIFFSNKIFFRGNFKIQKTFVSQKTRDPNITYDVMRNS